MEPEGIYGGRKGDVILRGHSAHEPRRVHRILLAEQKGASAMMHDADGTATSPTKPAARSAAAERMRLHRERRRLGLRCFSVQLRETEIDVLIGKGMLNAETRNDPSAITDALHDRTLRTLP